MTFARCSTVTTTRCEPSCSLQAKRRNTSSSSVASAKLSRRARDQRNHRASVGDREGGAGSSPARGRARHPPGRVDTQSPLRRQRQGRRTTSIPASRACSSITGWKKLNTRSSTRCSYAALAATLSPAQIETAVGDHLKIGAFIAGGLAQQIEFDREALETASGRLPLPTPSAMRSEVLS